MANVQDNEIETNNSSEDNSIDIIQILTDFIRYLKIDDEFQRLFKPSKIEIQNEMAFQQRAEKILKYHHQHNQITNEEKMISDLEQSINVITSHLDSEINKEKTTPKNITQIYGKFMTFKILDVKDSRNIRSLEDFIKSNKINLKEITKLEKEIKGILDKLTPKKISKKSKIKAPCTEITTRDRRSSISLSNIPRRINDTNNRIRPRTHVDRVRHFSNINNDDIILDSQTFNEILRLRLENDQARVESFINPSIIDQNTRYRYNDDLVNHDLILSRNDDDLVEYSSLNSTMNMSKYNGDNDSGDVYLTMIPHDDWMNT